MHPGAITPPAPTNPGSTCAVSAVTRTGQAHDVSGMKVSTVVDPAPAQGVGPALARCHRSVDGVVQVAAPGARAGGST